MKLGKDFVFVCRLVLAIIKALMIVFEGENSDTPGNGGNIK